MALITNYATLSTAVTDYLARSDLSGFVPNFIQNCESKVYKTLRLRTMETALSVTIAAGVAPVPADYLELKFANVSTVPVKSLERSTPEYIYAKYPVRSTAEIPVLIAREGDNFIFGPSPGNYTITGIYYKLLPSLSASNTSNWFITNAPELLLYGALLEAQPFLMNDKRLPVWQQMFGESMETVRRAEWGEDWSGSSLSVKAG